MRAKEPSKEFSTPIVMGKRSKNEVVAPTL